MKCSFGISNFLEKISSLSHSIVFLYFFALVTEEGFLISPCYSLELYIQNWVQSLLGEDLLEKEMTTHSSILSWKIPWMEEPGRLQFMGTQTVGHN